MKLLIERDIPIPKTSREGVDYVSLIRAMKTGDSFVVPFDKRAGAVSAFRRWGIGCTTRKTADGNIRVWRTDK